MHFRASTTLCLEETFVGTFVPQVALYRVHFTSLLVFGLQISGLVASANGYSYMAVATVD